MTIRATPIIDTEEVLNWCLNNSIVGGDLFSPLSRTDGFNASIIIAVSLGFSTKAVHNATTLRMNNITAGFCRSINDNESQKNIELSRAMMTADMPAANDKGVE
jgi:hypothetical protein